MAFATSAPEILVSVVAALHNESDLAIGNAIGSNIVNIGLVLGLVALIRPIPMKSATVQNEMPMLLAVSLLTVALFLDAHLSRVDGFVLLVGLVIAMSWLVRIGLRSSSDDPIVSDVEAMMPQVVSNARTGGQLVVGLATLLIGAELLVNGAVGFAILFGVSDILIGLVLVAFGTSLPELAVSLASALKGEFGMAIGNIVGSNIFNSLAVIGIASAIQPISLPSAVLSLHIFVMVAFTLTLFALTYDIEGRQEISRLEGFSMLIAFIAYEIHTVAPNFI